MYVESRRRRPLARQVESGQEPVPYPSPAGMPQVQQAPQPVLQRQRVVQPDVLHVQNREFRGLQYGHHFAHGRRIGPRKDPLFDPRIQLGGAVLADAVEQAAPVGASAGPQMASGGGVMVLPVKATPPNGQMLRDAQVEAYLRAHREALDGSPAALPGGGVRTVDFTVTQR